jgi:hypothetical protein
MATPRLMGRGGVGRARAGGSALGRADFVRTECQGFSIVAHPAGRTLTNIVILGSPRIRTELPLCHCLAGLARFHTGTHFAKTNAALAFFLPPLGPASGVRSHDVTAPPFFDAGLKHRTALVGQLHAQLGAVDCHISGPACFVVVDRTGAVISVLVISPRLKNPFLASKPNGHLRDAATWRKRADSKPDPNRSIRLCSPVIRVVRAASSEC